VVLLVPQVLVLVVPEQVTLTAVVVVMQELRLQAVLFPLI
jgi:hypothetical protein